MKNSICCQFSYSQALKLISYPNHQSTITKFIKFSWVNDFFIKKFLMHSFVLITIWIVYRITEKKSEFHFDDSTTQ